MRNFNFELNEFLEQTENTCIIRTADLLNTMLFMQEHGWRLWELLPDDSDGIEYNLLTFYKRKPGKK